MPELLAIGISHKTAPVALREKLALTSGQAEGLVSGLLVHTEVHEAIALSTCNRTELYFVTDDAVTAESIALGYLARYANIAPTELTPRLYARYGEEAAAHLMRVASGLESMIVGETEILGQVKRAHERALGASSTGPILNKLFAAAIVAAKRIQTETSLGAGGVSVSGAAVRLAHETVGDLAGSHALVVGAGQNGELTAKALSDAGMQTVFVANRHYDRAIGVAESIGGTATRFEQLPEQLARTDIVITSTGSPHTLIHADEMRTVMDQREGRPLLMIDIAVPRDIDTDVGELPGVTLFDFDGLQAAVERNLQARLEEVGGAETIVLAEARRFDRWVQTLDVVPTVAELRARAETIAKQVVAENASKFEGATEADLARIEAMAGSIVSRMLHEPTVKLKESAGEEAAYVYIEALRELFGLTADGDTNLDSMDRPPATIHSIEQQREQRGRPGGR